MCQIGSFELLCFLWGSRAGAVLWLVLAMHHSAGKGRQGLFSWLRRLLLEVLFLAAAGFCHIPPAQAFTWLGISQSTDSYLGRQDKAESHLAAEACPQLDAHWQVTSDFSFLHCRSFQGSVLRGHTTLCSMCLWMPACPSWWERADPCLIREGNEPNLWASDTVRGIDLAW